MDESGLTGLWCTHWNLIQNSLILAAKCVFMLAKICSFLVDSTFAADWVSLKFEERSEDKANFPERSEDKANFPETLNNIFPSCARWYKISETKFQSQQTYLLSSFTSKFQLPWPAKPPSLTASNSVVTYMYCDNTCNLSKRKKQE